MTSAAVFDRPTVDWERDGYDRPKIKPPVGETWPADEKGRVQAWKPYTRVTTWAKALDGGHALGEWKQRMTLLGAARRPDYVTAAASLTADPRDKKELQSLADKAKEAAGPNKADLGSALHRFTEALDRGESVEHVPEQYRVHLDNYARATSVLSFTDYETRTVCDELEVAGTPDRFGFCSIPDPDGVVDALRVIDTKTGRVDYPATMCTQLAIYWKSAKYDPATGQRTELPDLARSHWGIIVHLDVLTGECELYWIDLRPGWEGALLAGPVRAWQKATRKAGDILRPLAPEQPATEPQEPAVEPAAPSELEANRQLILGAITTADLALLWRDHGALWDQELQALAAERHAQLKQQEQLAHPRAALAAALKTADQAGLHKLWTEHGTTPTWTEEHAELARVRYQELNAAAA